MASFLEILAFCVALSVAVCAICLAIAATERREKEKERREKEKERRARLCLEAQQLVLPPSIPRNSYDTSIEPSAPALQPEHEHALSAWISSLGTLLPESDCKSLWRAAHSAILGGGDILVASI